MIKINERRAVKIDNEGELARDVFPVPGLTLSGIARGRLRLNGPVSIRPDPDAAYPTRRQRPIPTLLLAISPVCSSRRIGTPAFSGRQRPERVPLTGAIADDAPHLYGTEKSRL